MNTPQKPYAPPASPANLLYWLTLLAALWVLCHMDGIGSGARW